MTDRRNFIVGLAALPTVAAKALDMPADGIDMTGVVLPSWAEAAIARMKGRFLRWKGGDETVVVPTISDVHSFDPFLENPPDWNDRKMHVLLVRHAAEVLGADALIDLGDMGSDCSWRLISASWWHAENRMKSQVKLYEGVRDFPVLFCVGNHDRGNVDFDFPCLDFGKMFNARAVQSFGRLVLGPDMDFGYYDVPGKNCRLVFLNTSDETPGKGLAGYGISLAQVDFLKERALRVSGETSVIVFSHRCLHETAGQWQPVSKQTVLRLSSVRTVLEDFVRAGGRLCVCMSGDSHVDVAVTENGIRYLTTQGYGTLPKPERKPRDAVYLSFDPDRQMLSDVLVVKPQTGEWRVFRIGAGDESRDRN